MSNPSIKQLVFKELEELVPSALGMLPAADSDEISAVLGLVKSLVTGLADELAHRGFNEKSAIEASDEADKLAMHTKFNPP